MPVENSRFNGAIEEPIELFAGVRNVWEFVRRRKLWIIAGVVVGVAAAVGLRSVLPERHEVHAKILVIKKDSNLPTEGTAASRGFEGRMVEEILSTHMEILTSPRIISRALTAESLHSLPSILAGLKEGEDPVDYVRGRLDVSRGGSGQAKSAHVLNVTFEHPVPADGAKILTALIEHYQQFVEESFQSVGSEAVELISQVSENLANDLKHKHEALLEHREQAPLLWNGEETHNIHQSRIDQYETELAVLRVRKSRLQARLQIIEDRLRSPEADKLSDIDRLTLIAEEDIQRLSLLTDVERGSSMTEAFQAAQPARSQLATVKFDRLLTLRAEARALEEEFGPNHRQLRDKRREIEELEKVVEQGERQLNTGPERPELKNSELLKAYISLLKQDLAEVERREHALQELVSRELEGAKAFVRYELQDRALRDEIASSTELRNTVVDRLKEANLVRDYGGFVTEVLGPVQQAKPQKVSLPFMLMAGTILGCLAGTGVATLIDATDRSFRSPDEIRRILGLNVLAHVPRVRVHTPLRRRRGAETVDVAPLVWTAHRPRSWEAEVFRALRSELCYGQESGVLKIIQVTSPSPGDGKSVVAANLAVCLAQADRHVLLIDCDLRRPKQHELFQLKNDEGLSTLLAGESELPDVVQMSDVSGVSVLQGGPVPVNPAELLASSKFSDLLDLVNTQYDFIVLDSAPLLSVSDPMTIAPRADGVLMVMQLSKDARTLATAARAKLQSVKARMLGIVINCVDRRSRRYYGHTGLNPVDYSDRNAKRRNDYFIDTESTIRTAVR